MYSEVIFVLATCCVINASVITVNVYDDDPNNVVKSEDLLLSNCNPQECDQRCRRLKFPSGVCLNGRCKCDNFHTSEDFATLIEEFNSLGKCYPQECDQRCRRLKFPGGACVNGRCKCDNFRTSEDFAVLIEEYKSLRDCCPRECYKKCRQMNYPRGFCVKGECKCQKPREVEDELQQSIEDPEDYSSLNRCNPQECDQRCRRLKFPGGVCVHGHCKCNKSRTSEGIFHPEDFKSTCNCSSRDCNERCQMLGYAGGNCVKVGCVCKNTKIAEDDVADTIESSDPVDSSKGPVCYPKTCNRMCKLRGFKDGTCVNGVCKCTRKEDPAPTTSASIPKEPNKPETAANNELEESNLILNEEEEEIENNTVEHERVTRDKCYQYKCNDSCIRVGYTLGLCKKNKCKCS